MPIGVEVRTRTAPPSRGAPSETDTLFLTGAWTAGDLTEAKVVRSMVDVEASFAIRTGNEALWDYLDVFFREGGRRAIVSRYTTGGGTLLAGGLALFPASLGPGQVVAPGETPGAATFTALLAHAKDNNRVALFDVANNDTVAAMTTLAGTIPAGNKEYGALFGPWVKVPAPAGVSGGSERTVHATAVVAALIARADALGNPNRAAAGRDFPLQYASGFVRNITDAERQTLLNVGVNTFSGSLGALQLYGFQTAVTQSTETPFWQFNCARTRMWLASRAAAAGENYMFKPIDGRGRLASALKTDLDAICLELYGVNGLFGDTPQEAFSTEVGASINTTTTIAQGELNAVVEARLSLHAKRVLIDLISVPVTGRVSTSA